MSRKLKRPGCGRTTSPAASAAGAASRHDFQHCPFIIGIGQPDYDLPPNPTLKDLVDGYILGGFQAHLERVLDIFRQCDYATAVKFAGLSRCPVCNHVYPHQIQVYAAARQAFSDALCAAAAQLREAADFEELWEMTCAIARDTEGIGGLTCYDASLRIAANRNILPDVRVYAFRGATVREGQAEKNVIPAASFNPVIADTLPAYQIEDFLCVYGDYRFDMAKRPDGIRVLA